MKSHLTTSAPDPIGPYSQCVEAAGFVFVSGQLPLDPAKGDYPADDIKTLTARSIENMRHVLEAAGSDLNHVVKTTIFITDMNDFSAINEVYSTYFSDHKPARSVVAVRTLPKSAPIEIECIAVKAD